VRIFQSEMHAGRYNPDIATLRRIAYACCSSSLRPSLMLIGCSSAKPGDSDAPSVVHTFDVLTALTAGLLRTVGIAQMGDNYPRHTGLRIP
jgi:hypothetical protein